MPNNEVHLHYYYNNHYWKDMNCMQTGGVSGGMTLVAHRAAGNNGI